MKNTIIGMTLLVGTYTGEGSEGIYAYRFDQNSGELVSNEAVGFTKIENPSFLALSEKDIIYTVTENTDSTAPVTAFKFNPADYSFTKLSSVSSHGGGPCYISTNGELVAVGNYSGGNMAVFPIAADGAILNAIASVEGSATGPDQRRQIAPHMHCAVFSPDGKYLIASDFSADRLIRYNIATGQIACFPIDADSGPRHITFSPNGKQMYVICELSGKVIVFDYTKNTKADGKNADSIEEEYNLIQKQSVKADKVGARGAADIHISPDGKFLYTSLRLDNDGIAVFKIAKDGTLTEAGYTNTGKHPRNFTITPNGKFLLCACRDENSIEIYSRNADTGLLTKTDASIKISKPVCLVWRIY